MSLPLATRTDAQDLSRSRRPAPEERHLPRRGVSPPRSHRARVGRSIPDTPIVSVDVGAPSEREMEAQCFVQRCGLRGIQLSDPGTDSSHGNRPNLLGLCLRITIKTAIAGREHHLERVHPLRVRGDRNDGHHASPEATGRRVRTIVAHDHGWPSLVRLGTANGIEIDPTNLTTPHQPTPSATAASQRLLSSLASHSVHASS